MSEIKRFTNEQIDKVNSISLIDYARQNGYELKRFGKCNYKILGYGGLYINPDKNCFNWYSQNTGGGIIQFVMKFEKLTWVEAVKKLLNEEGITTYEITNDKHIDKTVEFVLPEKNHNYKSIYAYLIRTRMLDKQIVNKLINQDYIYENKYGSCVFVGKDYEGTPRSAFIRGTVTSFKQDVDGSIKDFSFNYPGNDIILNVFEGAIDTISYMTMQKNAGYLKQDHFVSLNCLSDRAMAKYLSSHDDIKYINLFLDNDTWGQNATEVIEDLYKDMYEIKKIRPRYKDVNEDLRHGINYLLASPKRQELHMTQELPTSQELSTSQVVPVS